VPDMVKVPIKSRLLMQIGGHMSVALTSDGFAQYLINSHDGTQCYSWPVECLRALVGRVSFCVQFFGNYYSLGSTANRKGNG